MFVMRCAVRRVAEHREDRVRGFIGAVVPLEARCIIDTEDIGKYGEDGGGSVVVEAKVPLKELTLILYSTRYDSRQLDQFVTRQLD